MTVGPIQTYVMDHESEADAYLTDLFKIPEFRNMHEVRRRAQTINFKNDHFRNYFINKGQELLKT